MNNCGIKTVLTGQYVMEGAGVKLKRLFGFHDTKLTDPFLLFDHFGSRHPSEYMKGFPWHPHRGIETVTYMISGQVEHQDSLGNKGIIGPGDTQWMTAGSGIIHQEMPREAENFLSGFQLWVNLPRTDKMTQPKYRDFSADAVPVYEKGGIIMKILSGELNGKTGAGRDISGDPVYADIRMDKNTLLDLAVPEGYKPFCYLFEGGVFTGDSSSEIIDGSMIVYGKGNSVHFETRENQARFIFFAGKPLDEPVAWQGPIVMNTQLELETAFREFHEGTFIKQR